LRWGYAADLNGEVMTIRLRGLAEPLEPTATHPLFSEDRQAWVRAGELREGERLRTLHGAAEIVSIARKPGVHRVYNLEVQPEHTYFVSKVGVLVHNVSGCAEPNPGSYTNTHESGTRYHGKGPPERAAQSASEKAAANGDPLANSDWTPAESERAAFKKEAERIAKDGGPGLPNNYNKINSPGKKDLNEDCKK
jgi:hypothetical protein